MAEKESWSGTKEKYVPPKILATYSKKELDEMIKLSGLHGGGGCGCGCGTGSILYPPVAPWEGPYR